MDGSSIMTAGVVSFLGSHVTTPLGSAFTANGTGTTPSVGVTDSVTGDLVSDVQVNGCGGASVGAGQTQRWLQQFDCLAYGNNGGGSTEPGASGTVTMSWAITSDSWGIIAVTIKQAAGGGPPQSPHVVSQAVNRAATY
jgi:hypothetical protein